MDNPPVGTLDDTIRLLERGCNRDELLSDLMAYIDRFDGAEYGLVMIAIKRYAAAAVAREREKIAAMFDANPNAEMFRQDIADAIRKGE